MELAKNAEADAADVEGASNAAIDVAAEKGGDNTKTEGRIGAEKHDRSDGESGENTGKGVAAASTPKTGGPGGEDKANGKAEDRDDEAKVKDGGEEDAKAKEDAEAMTQEATDEKTKKEADEKGKEEAESKVNEGEKKKEENPPPKKKKGFCAIL